MGQSHLLSDAKSPHSVDIFVNNPGSAALPHGEPVNFIMNGTNDGRNVQNANSGGAAGAHTLFAGVVLEAIPANEGRRVRAAGFVNELLLLTATRAASTDSYASAAAVAIGDVLNIDTNGNGFSRSAAGAATADPGAFIAAQTLASVASAASTTSDTSTRRTSLIKAFIRAM